MALFVTHEGLDDYEYLKALEDSKTNPAELQAMGRHCHLDPRTGTMV